MVHKENRYLAHYKEGSKDVNRFDLKKFRKTR
jgi:hypothetical protein